MKSSNSNSAHISVPASSANLGPGFDCLALALNVRLTAKADWDDAKVKLRVCAEKFPFPLVVVWPKQGGFRARWEREEL